MFGGKYKGGLAPLYSRKIKKLREKRQLTQKQLAELSGISESALRSYELGDRKPKKEVLEHIAKALESQAGVPVHTGVRAPIGVFLRPSGERRAVWIHHHRN